MRETTRAQRMKETGMGFLDEYWLLIVVSLPVLVVVAIQVALFVAGERETLLLPGFKRFEKVALAAEPAVRIVERRVAPPMSLPPSLERRRRCVREGERAAA